MGVHDGHRKRRREQFIRHGLDAFADHEVLELLLFYAIGRRDTNPIAHALLDHFGSLPAVFAAPLEELEQVEGMGPHAASLVALLPAIFRRLRLSAEGQNLKLTTTEEMGAYFLDLFFGQRSEVMYQVCLDGKGKVLCCRRLSEGGASAAECSVRRVVEIALRCNAVGVVLAHNHPSGLALPSREDYVATSQVTEALSAIGVRLVDHIIVADQDFVSMAENGSIAQRCF